MQLDRPDPAYTGSARSRQNFVLALKISAGFVALCWAVFLVDLILDEPLIRYGLQPRVPEGLLGLFTTPLLHGNFAHIFSNTAPLFVALTACLYLYPNSSLRAIPWMYVGSSGLAWLFARPSLHVGASGFVYGLLAFVFFGGVLRRDMRSMAVSFLVFFLYGSMVWGVLPAANSRMSWELHLSGAVIGFVLALVFRRWDRPPVKRYDWEDEEDGEDPRPCPDTDPIGHDPTLPLEDDQR